MFSVSQERSLDGKLSDRNHEELYCFWGTLLPPARLSAEFSDLSTKTKMGYSSNLFRDDSRFARSRSPGKRAAVMKRASPVLVPAVNAWVFGKPADPLNNGLKSAPISYEGQPIVLTVNGAFSPFEPSALTEESTRKTFTLRLPRDWEDALDCMEACIVQKICEHSEVYFGTALDEEQVRSTYKAITKKTGDYPRNLRAKLNTEGPYSARFWAVDKSRIDAPETLAGVHVNVKCVLRALWFGDEAWGIVADCTDVQLVEQVDECPF